MRPGAMYAALRHVLVKDGVIERSAAPSGPELIMAAKTYTDKPERREPLFKLPDDIITMGKLMYLRIPSGARCKSCPFLQKTPLSRGWYCDLRSAFALFFDEEGAIKDSACPRPKTKESQ